MMSPRVLAAGLACLFVVSCTEPAPSAAPAAATAASVLLHNAYTAVPAAAGGDAMEPAKSFTANQPVHVVVVVRGQSEASEVVVQWSSAAGEALGTERTRLPVGGEAKAHFNLTRTAPLEAGGYKVLVLLDGTPSWELAFDVVD